MIRKILFWGIFLGILSTCANTNASTLKADFHDTVNRMLSVVPNGLEYTVNLDIEADYFNAYIEIYSKEITITLPALLFMENSDQLALILGHEICHSLLQHERRTTEKGYKERELAADLCGVSLALAAGYECNKMITVWLRIEEAYPSSDGHSTHPKNLERYKTLKKICS